VAPQSIPIRTDRKTGFLAQIVWQLQDSREAYSVRPNIPGVQGAEGDDEFDLRQAYIALGDLKKFPSF
jgi:hypothetical protein